MKTLDAICAALLIVGGLNWGLVGFFEFDLVAAIFGGTSAVLSRIVYALVGLSALYIPIGSKGIRNRWANKIRDLRTPDHRSAA